ncbi:MAG: DUF1987 domain-containing protein [Crocinitomicaceae bacterium]
MTHNLQIEVTNETPRIDFNIETGILEISGVSISHQSDLFFQPINEWIANYIEIAKPVTQLIIKLDFFNISSSKHLLDILYKLKSLQNKGLIVAVEWHYINTEDDMLELGQDYEMMVRLPFKYVGHKLIEGPVC